MSHTDNEQQMLTLKNPPLWLARGKSHIISRWKKQTDTSLLTVILALAQTVLFLTQERNYCILGCIS